jgi:hypothetical protein
MLFEVGSRVRAVVLLRSRGFQPARCLGRSIPIWERHGPGHFLGEIAQPPEATPWSTSKPAAPGGAAAPEKLRALLVAEVEPGRAHPPPSPSGGSVCWRSALAARVLIGPPTDRGSGAPGILLRSGHPHRADPEADANAASLVERHAAGPDDLPLVICPGGSVLKNPVHRLAVPERPAQPRSGNVATTSPWSVPVRLGQQLRSMQRRRVSTS